MTTLTRIAVGALSLLVAGCASSKPPFAEQFPEPIALVTTDDPESALQRLQASALPETAAHEAQLLALLCERERIDAAHLVLLVNAVANDGSVVHAANGRTFVYGRRGVGKGSATVELLLNEGLDKLQHVDRVSFGRLLARTQHDATLHRYCDRLLAQLDDSPEATDEILGAMAGSPAIGPFVLGVLQPRGRLAGDRGWRALTHLTTDADRLQLLTHLTRESAPIDGERLVAALRTLQFDDSRTQAFAMLADTVATLGIEHAHAAVATFSFDGGREAAIAAIGRQGRLQLDDAQLLAMVRLCLFDSSKVQCVEALAPKLTGAPDGGHAENLLRSFSFDSDRLRVVQMLTPRWRQLRDDERARLVATFLLDDDRSRARELLQ